MQGFSYLEGDSRSGLVELLALDFSDIQFQLGWLSGTSWAGEGASAPWRATVDLLKVAQQSAGVLVAQWNVDQTVVGEGGHGVGSSHFLATAWGAGGDEDGCELAVESALAPKAAGGINEGLPLGWEVTVSSWDTEEESVILSQGLGGSDRVVGLWWSMHFLEDLRGKRLWDLVQVGSTAGSLDTLLDGKGHLADVAPGGVVKNGDSWSGWHF